MSAARTRAIAVGLLLVTALFVGFGHADGPHLGGSSDRPGEVVTHLGAAPAVSGFTLTSRTRPLHRLAFDVPALGIVLLAMAVRARRLADLRSRTRPRLRWLGATLRGPPALA